MPKTVPKLMVVALLSAAIAFAAPAEPSRTGQSDEIFGFHVGEERRYVLGPPEALDPGEGATWMIRLDRIRDNGEAVFALEHQRTGPDVTSSSTPAYGEELEAQMEGELTVNEHGFPVSLEFDVRRSAYGYADDVFYARYEFDGRSYVKRIDTFGKQWDIAIPISGHDNLDKKVPIGLYLFLPDAFHCVGFRPSIARVASINQPPATTGSGLSPAGQPPRVDRFAQRCEPNTDLGFLNPGLLSLAWPAVLEAGEEEDFLFFTPTGADLFPGVGGVTVGGISPGPQSPGGVDKARDPRRYYNYSRIELGERTEIRVRGRAFGAIAGHIRGLAGVAYFDDEGKALLVEMDFNAMGLAEGILAAALSGGGSLDFNKDQYERRHIRLMFPSEY